MHRWLSAPSAYRYPLRPGQDSNLRPRELVCLRLFDPVTRVKCMSLGDSFSLIEESCLCHWATRA